MQINTDIAITDDGDMIFENDDLLIINNDAFLRQQVICRVKSVKADWYIDAIGADMEELIGEPNTIDIAEIGRNKIIEALTYDGFLTEDDMQITKKPSSKYSIVYDIAVRSSEQIGYIPIQVALDLTAGINVI